MNGRGEDASEDTTRPGMQCKDNTQKGGKARDCVPQMLLTPAYATQTWERVCFYLDALSFAQQETRKSVVNSVNNFKTMSERKHKHFNINESGVDNRKSNMKKGRFIRGKKELCLQEGKSVNNDEGSC